MREGGKERMRERAREGRKDEQINKSVTTSTICILSEITIIK